MKQGIFISLFVITFCAGFAQSLDEKLAEANRLYFSGEVTKAISLCDELLEEGHEIPEVYLMKGRCLMEGKNYFKSNDSLYKATLYNLDKALELDQFYELVYEQRGRLHFIHKRFHLAIKDFTTYIALVKDSALIFNGLTNRGTSKMQIEDYEGAIEDYELAKKYNPYHVSIYRNLGSMYIDIGDYEKAKELLFAGLELYPKEDMILNNIGFLFLNLEDYKSAITYLTKAISINPQRFSAFSNRGYCYLKLGQLDKAIKDLNHSISLYPENSYVFMYKGLYYIELEDYEKACENFYTAKSLGFIEIYGRRNEELINLYCKK